MVKSEIERGLPFVIPDRMCEFQMICLRDRRSYVA